MPGGLFGKIFKLLRLGTSASRLASLISKWEFATR